MKLAINVFSMSENFSIEDPKSIIFSIFSRTVIKVNLRLIYYLLIYIHTPNDREI